MLKRIVVTVALVIAGCEGPTVEQSDNAIQGGTPDTGDAAVALLFRPPGTLNSSDGGGWCSATMVTPTIALTAAHCVSATGAMKRLYLGEGVPEAWDTGPTLPTPDPSMTEYDIVETYSDPQWANLACASDTHDVALVRVVRNTHSATAAYATAASDEPAAGAGVTASGFGLHQDPSSNVITWGQKRDGSSSLVSVAAQLILAQYASAIADSGDSGGPIFYNGKIVGTTLCHTDGDWTGGTGGHRQEYYQRTDTEASFIQQGITKLDADCEAASCGGTAPPCTTCLCLAQRYACDRNICGESRPVISCRPGVGL